MSPGRIGPSDRCGRMGARSLPFVDAARGWWVMGQSVGGLDHGRHDLAQSAFRLARIFCQFCRRHRWRSCGTPGAFMCCTFKLMQLWKARAAQGQGPDAMAVLGKRFVLGCIKHRVIGIALWLEGWWYKPSFTNCRAVGQDGHSGFASIDMDRWVPLVKMLSAWPRRDLHPVPRLEKP